jgi:pilus assembly protein CpaB
MSARQLIVLVIAAIAAIGALLLIRGMGQRDRAEPTMNATPIVGEQVLVAGADIAQGAALTPSDLAVATFPTDSVSPSFIRISAEPGAQAGYVGAVARRAFAKGEPITTGAIVQPEGRGFMAAQLAPGYRAVAIEIESGTAAGGFIQPNDHVDVIVTTNDEPVTSSVVAANIRVLALGDKTQVQTEGEAPERIQADVAVLELTSADARAVSMARELGSLSLALRGVQSETTGMGATGSGAPTQAAATVRVHAFGTALGGGQ